MPESLSTQAQELIKQIGRQGVIDGREECIYHIVSENWQPFSLLPPQLRRSVEIGQSTLDPKPHFHPEAFSYNPDALVSYFQVVFTAETAPSFQFRFFTPPQVKEEELFQIGFQPQIRKIRQDLKHLKKYLRYSRDLPTRISLPEIHPNPNFTPTPEVPIEPLITDLIISRFEYWKKGDYQSKTGHDLHRARMTIAGFPDSLKLGLSTTARQLSQQLPSFETNKAYHFDPEKKLWAADEA